MKTNKLPKSTNFNEFFFCGVMASYSKNQSIKRKAIHNEWGGNRQYGISVPSVKRKSKAIFLSKKKIFIL